MAAFKLNQRDHDALFSPSDWNGFRRQVDDAIEAFSTGSLSAANPPVKAGPIRAGMIGLDTSHVVAFTQILNDPKAAGELRQLKIVAGFPGGSPDNPSSWDRVPQYTKELRGMGVEIVGSIDELLKKVDVVLLMSVDGRPHLAQARPVIAAGKPLFIDKPMAASLADAMEIFRLAEEKHVPCFSSSALRFSSGFQAVRQKKSRFGDVRSCLAWSPLHLEPHHPDLFWYGIHGVETLYTIMGPGCETVTRAGAGQGGRRLGRRPHGNLHRQGRLRGPGPGEQGERAGRQVRGLSAAGGRDRPLLQDGPAAGGRRRDARNPRFHGGRRREQASARGPREHCKRDEEGTTRSRKAAEVNSPGA